MYILRYFSFHVMDWKEKKKKRDARQMSEQKERLSEEDGERSKVS